MCRAEFRLLSLSLPLQRIERELCIELRDLHRIVMGRGHLLHLESQPGLSLHVSAGQRLPQRARVLCMLFPQRLDSRLKSAAHHLGLIGLQHGRALHGFEPLGMRALHRCHLVCVGGLHLGDFGGGLCVQLQRLVPVDLARWDGGGGGGGGGGGVRANRSLDAPATPSHAQRVVCPRCFYAGSAERLVCSCALHLAPLRPPLPLVEPYRWPWRVSLACS